MDISAVIHLWKSIVEKPVENVEKCEFSTGISGFSTAVAGCAGCIFGCIRVAF